MDPAPSTPAGASRARDLAAGLVEASHPGPCVAVTTVAVLLGLGAGLDAVTLVVVGAAVLAGQLTIGWSNDLLDAERDRAVGRTDKPLPSGRVTERALRRALRLGGVLCLGLSLLLGPGAAVANLLGAVSGWVYNLRLKATAWSWAPYAVAFGALPAVPTLADVPPTLPPAWQVVAGAALGVAAHLVNVVPDLADDEATGVRGLPHRLGATTSRRLAAALLLGTSVLLVATAPGGLGDTWWLLPPAAMLAAVAVVGQGRTPFRAAMALAVLDVVLLVALG